MVKVAFNWVVQRFNAVDLEHEVVGFPAGWKGREGELEELGQAAGSRARRGHGSDVFGTGLMGIQ